MYASYRLGVWMGSENAAAMPISRFVPFTLESKDAISPTAAIFNLRVKAGLEGAYRPPERPVQGIWSVDIKQPQLQVAREYTPLPPMTDERGRPVEGEEGRMHLLIRQEFKGEVSSYLHRLPIGSTIEISQPKLQVQIPEDVSDAVFIVGGTGITTALQALEVLLESRRGRDVRVHVLWANRRREDCVGGVSDTRRGRSLSERWYAPLFSSRGTGKVGETELGKSPIVDELKRLKGRHEGRLKIDYFVDEEGTFLDKEAINSALTYDTAKGRAVVGISGPDGFMLNLSGEKRRNKNEVTGPPMNGLLSDVKRKDWNLIVLG